MAPWRFDSDGGGYLDRDELARVFRMLRGCVAGMLMNTHMLEYFLFLMLLIQFQSSEAELRFYIQRH